MVWFSFSENSSTTTDMKFQTLNSLVSVRIIPLLLWLYANSMQKRNRTFDLQCSGSGLHINLSSLSERKISSHFFHLSHKITSACLKLYPFCLFGQYKHLHTILFKSLINEVHCWQIRVSRNLILCSHVKF